MPFYEYECPDCHERTTIASLRSEDAPQVGDPCPYCHGPRMVRQISTPNFTIQGFSNKNGYSK